MVLGELQVGLDESKVEYSESAESKPLKLAQTPALSALSTQPLLMR
jgi:hypothetical protein